MDNKNYYIVKVFNNNIVLALEDSSEKIILGKGIGFGKKIGDTIHHSSSIEKVFSLQEPANRNKFKELINNVDEDIISICEEIITMIEDDLRETLQETIHISLTDHISFALRRLKENNGIENPFLIETEVLFKKEYSLALKAVGMLEGHTGIKIPNGEAGFIALHIHSARNKGTLSKTIKYTYLFNSIVKFVEESLNVTLNRESLNYARFIVHLRFAIERLVNNTPIRNDLLATIKRKYRHSYKISEKIGELIEKNLNISVVPDEIGYIAIHLENLAQHEKGI